MKKTYQIFVGVDVSKSKLDYSIVNENAPNKHQFGVIANTMKAICSLIKGIIIDPAAVQNVLLCLENTGVYSMPICYWLQANKCDYWVVPALEVKRSKGITRGKTDKTDAKDIAYYAITHIHELKLSQLPENDFIELRLLMAEREKIVKSISTFKSSNETKSFLPQNVLSAVLKHNRSTVGFLQKQLKAIEKLIANLIAHNPVFKNQDELLRSIPGVGRQTSVMLIAYAQAFSLFKTHRQFACFAGVAPFEYSSGSSIKKKTKVSNLANKKIKTTLNMSALSAKKYDPELRIYFDKKIKEGKNKMLVLNAIRCKVISRAFAVISRNSKFVNTLKAVA